MSEISKDDVVATFGPMDDATIATIIATGATPADLVTARDWVGRDAAHTNTARSLPLGPMGRVVEIVERYRLDRVHPSHSSLLGNAGSGSS